MKKDSGHHPLFFVTERLEFPPVEHANEEGLLAVGGDLSSERLLLAY
ncbi:MAG: leucyl/phenylalanyl-tRNA--protein transferase, partial [Sediminicola sp.]